MLLIVNVARRLMHFPSTTSIDVFFFWQPGETAACLSKLASIIECGRGGRISLLHTSLSDFLFDPARSHQLYLCHETVLSDCAALGLRHVRPEVLVTKGMWFAHSEMFILRVLNSNMVILRTPSLLHYSHQVY